MLKGLKKHFNSTTLRGRANVAKVTYATFALIYLYHRFGKKKGVTPAKVQARGSSCATFADGDTTKEPRGSCGANSSEGQGESCATFQYNGDGEAADTKAAGEANAEEHKSLSPSVSSESDTAKQVLYGPPAKSGSGGTTKIVTRVGAAMAVGKMDASNMPEKSKAELSTSKEENVASNVKESLALDKIEQGTLQNVEAATSKGAMEQIGEIILQSF